MSVLKKRRQESKCQYVYNAHEIFLKTINFLSRLSARYSRLLAADTAQLASSVINYAEAAENVYTSDDIRVNLRKTYLLKARAALSALDIRMGDIYNILSNNPEGAFTTANDKNMLKGSEAREKLDKMSMDLGTLIDTENSLLTAMLSSVKLIKEKSDQH